MKPPYDDGMEPDEHDLNALPAISIQVKPREEIVIGLGDGYTYTVREPKAVEAESSTASVMRLIAHFMKVVGTDTEPSLPTEEVEACAPALWEYLDIVLGADPEDYPEIRERVYGTPKNPEDLKSHKLLTRDDLDTVSDDDLEIRHIVDVVSQLLVRWHPEWGAMAEQRQTKRAPREPQDHRPKAVKTAPANTATVRKKQPRKAAATRGTAG